ncbi:MAG: Smr/MutS family protein [Chitinophagaceae bacterium]
MPVDLHVLFMKYQPGDKIILLHSDEEGEVVDIINDKMVMIDIKGVQFPAYNDQIDFPYFKMFTEKKLFTSKKEKKYIDDVRKEKQSAKEKVSNGVWLSFIPIFDKDIFDDDVVENFKLYLVNQTHDDYKFNYRFMIGGGADFELKNQLLPMSEFYVHNVDFEKMNDAPRFDIEFSLTNPQKSKAPYFESSLKIKAKHLFQKIEEMQLKNLPNFSYQLFDEYPDKVEDNKPDLGKLAAKGYKIYEASQSIQNLEPARSVVDLHIEKLSDDYKHLSNFEILTIQLRALEKYYDLAIAHRLQSLIVIHGVGKGKLKDEIHEILKSKVEVSSFVNQYHSNFGYGATEILFKY